MRATSKVSERARAIFLSILFSISLLTVSCASTRNFTEEEIAQESKKVNDFFAKEFKESLDRYPMFYTYLGQKKRYDELNDTSYEFILKSRKLTRESLKQLKNFNYNALDEETKLSYRIYKKMLESEIEGFKYDINHYHVNQMFGAQTHYTSFMINKHRIDNESDAKAYISRVKGFKKVFSDLLVLMKKQERRGVKYPHFIFAKVIADANNVIAGRPFDGKKDSPIYNDFKTKLKKLKISNAKKKILTRELEIALITMLKPGYESLIDYLAYLEKKSPESKGAWAMPNGRAYYNYRLKEVTTTDMTAPEIHKLGLKEVERIQNEMREIMKKLNFQGDLQEFFTSVKSNKKFFYPSTKKGKAQYLKDAKKYIDDMEKKLDELFITKPKARLVVKPVEAFREKSAGIAFYEAPAIDGSRPGIYYVNLSDMASVAKYDMEALAYHEGIPGHHMENSISQEIEDIPMFRKFAFYYAYSEGWGLYSEYIPKEIGFYKDLYSDFGRLSMELWRAARLVVDTGIHYYKWDREKVVKYLQDNTPNSQDEIDKGAERYFVMPGQATAYKIGQLKILSLRKKAKKDLGAQFDIREFHESILGNGPVPLYELEHQIEEYIESKSRSADTPDNEVERQNQKAKPKSKSLKK